MNTVVESYFFAKVDKSPQAATPASSADESDTVYTPGLRASTNPIEGLNVQAEVAWQRGNKVVSTTGAGQNFKREAMAAEAIVNYQLPVLKEWKPVVTGVYSYTSGDSNPDDRASFTEKSREKWTGWDPMFENQGGGTVYNTLFDLTNSHIYIVSGQVNVIEDLLAKISWTGIWIDRPERDGLLTIRQPDGTTDTMLIDNGDTEVGHEIDAELIYDYTEDVQLGLNLGWFAPGDLFLSANDNVASQAIVHADVNF